MIIKKRIRIHLGIFLIICAIVIISSVAYRNSVRRQTPVVFSENSMLEGLWNNYKSNYLESGTERTLDKQQDNITTSEGEAYTLLRSVWMDDQTTFDQSWKWINENLNRSQDNLTPWLFGKRKDGTYGIIAEQGGNNTASDGDTDIALALVFANSRWGDPKYLDAARGMISDIWDKEVVIIQGKPYLAANDLEKNAKTSTIVVNPSYLAPYAYRIFAKIDTQPNHDWSGLVDSSYELLQKSSASLLDTNQSVNLPPDWIELDRKTAAILPPTRPNLTSHFSYDAFRIPFRVSLDWEWNNDPKAKDYLSSLYFLSSTWQSQHIIYPVYTHDGQALATNESPALYGATLGYFMITNSDLAKEIYKTKLASLYDPDTFSWKQPLSYYDDNWAWFGIAFYQGKLINLNP